MADNATAEPRDEVWETLKGKLGLSETRAKAVKASGSSPVTGWDSQNLLTPCGDGERTTHLVGLAGSYFARGFALNQVIEHCLLWNTQNTPPLDEEKVVRTCVSIGSSDARNHPNRDRSQAFSQLLAETTTALFDITEARIDGFLATPPLPRRWVLEGVLPLGIVAALVSPGGVGKSQLLMQLGYSVATGILLAGHWEVGEPGTVLMLCAEDDTEEIHRRVSRIHQQLGLAMSATATAQLVDRLLIRSMVGVDTLLTEATGGGEVLRTRLTERLLLTAKQAGNLKLIIIDPASRFRGGDENSNADATRFVQALEYLAQQTGATVLVAHHSSKGAMNSQETNQSGARGASAFTDGIRWQMALTSLANQIKGYKGLPARIRHRYLEAKLVKTNYTAPQPEVLLLRGEDGYLQVTSDVSNDGPGSPKDEFAELAVLSVIHKQPQGITARQLEAVYGGVNKDLQISEKGLRVLLAAAEFKGLLVTSRGKPLKLTPKALGLLKVQPGAKQGRTAARHRAAMPHAA